MMKKWEPCHTNIQKSNNHRILQELSTHTEQAIKTTSTEDLDPRPLTNNDHVLPFEMYTLEPGEIPSRTLTSKPLGFLVILSVVPMMIGSHFLCGRFGFVRVSVYQFRL
jgi:hypothetical protein